MKNKDKKKGVKVNRKELIGTVDIGMKTNYGYFRTWEMEETSSFAFENNMSGYRRYYGKMREFMKACGGRI